MHVLEAANFLYYLSLGVPVLPSCELCRMSSVAAIGSSTISLLQAGMALDLQLHPLQMPLSFPAVKSPFCLPVESQHIVMYFILMAASKAPVLLYDTLFYTHPNRNLCPIYIDAVSFLSNHPQ